MLIELSKEQIEYLVAAFDGAEDVLDDFEVELLEVLEMAMNEDEECFENDIYH